MTPRAITAGELVKLRSNGQWSKLHVLIDAPNTVYTARATGPVSTGFDLGFDGGTGTIGDAIEDMPILLGSSAGASDLGVGRLRKDSIAGTFYLGADPSLVVADNDYITVLNDFPLFAKHSVNDKVDVNAVYNNHFTNFIPNPIVDEGRIAVIDAGGTAAFHAGNSWVLGSTISAYAWVFTGATSSTGTAAANSTATYNTSGRYRWKLTVTAANGASAFVFGWVYVLGVNLAPDGSAVIDQIEGSTDSGWATRISCYDRPTIKDGARVIIYADDYYDNVFGCIGPVTGQENLVMVGWIIGETIVRDPKKDMVEFEVGGPLTVLSRLASKPVGLTNTAFPTDDAATLPAWSKMATLTAAKGLHTLINYYSTLIKVCNVYVEDWGFAVHKLASDADNILGQLDDFAANAALTVSSDRFGNVYIQRPGRLYPIADRTANIPNVMTLTDVDWQEDQAIIRRHEGEASMAEAEGFIFSGGTLTQVGGRSPGHYPGRFGGIESLGAELNVSFVADVKELAGLLAGALNTEYEGIVPILSQNNRFIDITPRQFVTITVDGETIRAFPKRVTFRPLEGAGFWGTELELEPEGDEWPAVAIDYPSEGEPPVEPPTEPPEEPPVPPEEPPVDEEDEPGVTEAVVATATDVETTGDLDVASPTWVTEL